MKVLSTHVDGILRLNFILDEDDKKRIDELNFGMDRGWNFPQHPLYFLRTHSRTSFCAVSIWDGLIRSAVITLDSAPRKPPFNAAISAHMSEN